MTRFYIKSLGKDGDVDVLPQAVQTAIDQVHTVVRTEFVPKLRNITPFNRGEPPYIPGSANPNPNIDLVPDDGAYTAAGVSTQTYNLLMMPDFYSLAPIAQYLSVPAPFVTRQMGQALEKWCGSEGHKAAIVTLVAAGGIVDVETDVSFNWTPDMAARAQRCKLLAIDCVNKIVELMGAPMVVRNRPFMPAYLAPLFNTGAAPVSPNLVFMTF